MRDKFKIKSVYTMLMVILMGFVLVESNYWYLLSILVCSSDTRYVIWGTLIILTVIAQKLKIRKTYIFVPWLFYIAMILFRNQEFAHGRYSNTERLILCITMVFVCAYKSDWVKKIPKMIVAIGIPNVIATLVFLVNDSLYKVFISRTYGEYQSGTEYGKYGYRAALADHYSQNATYISMVVLALFVLFLTEERRKKKFFWGVLLGASVIALLLTSKRAHLLFCVAAAIIVYYLAYPQKRLAKTFKLVIAGAVIAFGLALVSEYIPQINNVFERFQTAGTDKETLGRFIMWNYAFELFKQNPLFGTGWWGFRYSGITNIRADALTGCHNVYIEILSNCGIVGFVIFIIALISALYITMKNIKFCIDNELESYKMVVLCSAVIQAFCLMYCMTGNVMFDRTFHFYIIAVVMSVSFYLNKENIAYMEEEKKDYV